MLQKFLSKKRMWIPLLLVLVVVTAFLYFKDKVYETQSYTILAKTKYYELRRYDSHIIARAPMSLDTDRRGMGGTFRVVGGYIFGNNQSQTSNGADSIEMTTPVITEISSQEIKMTTPVVTEIDNDQGTMAFVMPSKWTLETLPKPLDSRVELVEVPERLMASRRYFGGTYDQSAKETALDSLRQALERDSRPIVGNPQFAFYNGPWTPWFMQRNEVLFEVEN